MLTLATVQAVSKIRENSTNQGPGIAKYWDWTDYGYDGYKNREPWCAAFLCWLVGNATYNTFAPNRPFKPCRSAGVVKWIAWAKEQPGWKFYPGNVSVRAGDIILFDFNGSRAAGTHIALAVSDENPGTQSFDTIEGNTDSVGSREGNGVFKKSRSRNSSVIGICRYVG